MPMYVYRCEAGHTFEQQGKMDGSDAPAACIHGSYGGVATTEARVICALPVQKVLAAPARVFPGADSWRR